MNFLYLCFMEFSVSIALGMSLSHVTVNSESADRQLRLRFRVARTMLQVTHTIIGFDSFETHKYDIHGPFVAW